jgi:hypothetical protein
MDRSVEIQCVAAWIHEVTFETETAYTLQVSTAVSVQTMVILRVRSDVSEKRTA